MQEKNYLEQLSVPFDPKKGTLASVNWYKDRVRQLFHGVSPERLMQSPDSQTRMASKVLPGSMYLYFYNPKHKDTLPYYDIFPLVLPFKRTTAGFLGLNFHYLPYPLRIKLLNGLLTFRNNKKMDETTKIRTSWQLLQSSSTGPIVAAAAKQYLFDHVRSKYLTIYPNEWPTAMMLPVERFKNVPIQTVFDESKAIIGKSHGF